MFLPKIKDLPKNLLINQAKFVFAGDPLPSYGDKIRLFAMRLCPYVQRVLLVLKAKEIPFDVVYINLDNKPDWYKSINPLGMYYALLLCYVGIFVCNFR